MKPIDDSCRSVAKSASGVLSAARRIARENGPAARPFRNALLRAAQCIGQYKECGALRSDLADPPFRFLLLSGFPYVIVYNPEREPPLIVRILHGAHDLPEILKRL
jgi:toxin ParE1/3/4